MSEDRYHRTREPLALIAQRRFEAGEEERLWKVERDALEAAEKARVAHERAQLDLQAASTKVRDARHWNAVALLSALGLPVPDRMGSEEAWAYLDCDEVVIGIRKKAKP